jgi:hypothetical protein
MEEYDKTEKTEAPKPPEEKADPNAKPKTIEGFATAIHPVHIILLIVMPILFLYVIFNIPKMLPGTNINIMAIATRGGGFLFVLGGIALLLWFIGAL